MALVIIRLSLLERVLFHLAFGVKAFFLLRTVVAAAIQMNFDTSTIFSVLAIFCVLEMLSQSPI